MLMIILCYSQFASEVSIQFVDIFAVDSSKIEMINNVNKRDFDAEIIVVWGVFWNCTMSFLLSVPFSLRFN